MGPGHRQMTGLHFEGRGILSHSIRGEGKGKETRKREEDKESGYTCPRAGRRGAGWLSQLGSAGTHEEARIPR